MTQYIFLFRFNALIFFIYMICNNLLAADWRCVGLNINSQSCANIIFLLFEIENENNKLNELTFILNEMNDYQRDILIRTLLWYKEFEQINNKKNISWNSLAIHFGIVATLIIATGTVILLDAYGGGMAQNAQHNCVDEHVCVDGLKILKTPQEGYICLNGTINYDCAAFIKNGYTPENNLPLDYMFNCSSECIDFCSDMVGTKIPYVNTFKLLNNRCHKMLASLPFLPSMISVGIAAIGISSLGCHALKHYFFNYRSCINFELVPKINNMKDLDDIIEKLQNNFEDISEILKSAVNQLRIKIGYEGST